MAQTEPSPVIQAAVKNMATGDVVYFAIPIAVETLFVLGPALDPTAFAASWKGVGDDLEVSVVLNGESCFSCLNTLVPLSYSYSRSCFPLPFATFRL